MQHFFNADQLAKMEDLTLMARTVVAGFMPGIHRSPNTGSSIEFAHYRPYSQGDDPRYIDWKLFARNDRLHIKQFQEETNLRATLLVDCSASMGYGSTSVTKLSYARLLAACLVTMLHQQGDAVGLAIYHRELVRHLPPRRDPRRLRTLWTVLAGMQPGQATDTPGALKFLGDVLQPRGLVVLISDLLHPLEDAVSHLKSLRARRHDLLVFQISDPAERTFSFDRTVTLVDAETGKERYVVPQAVREGYLANRQRHFDALRKACLGSEIDLVEIGTDQPLDWALRHYLHHRHRALMTGGMRQTGRVRRA